MSPNEPDMVQETPVAAEAVAQKLGSQLVVGNEEPHQVQFQITRTSYGDTGRYQWTIKPTSGGTVITTPAIIDWLEAQYFSTSHS